MANLKIRQADQAEIRVVLMFLKDAAIWLRQRNVDYWQNWHDPPENHVRWIQSGFDRDEFYIVECDGEAVGCFRLRWSDETFWGPQPDEAGYIHSFTICRDRAGHGIGRSVLRMIEDVCRENAKRYLRLDCGSHVAGLLRYYQSCGFIPVGETIVHGEHLTLFQKRCDRRV